MRMTIVLADKEPGFRGLAKWALETALNVTVVGETGDIAEAVRLARELRPDVVLMEIAMLGRETIRRIRAERPETRIVILTDDEGEKENAAAAALGGEVILLKKDLLSKLCGGLSRREALRSDPRDSGGSGSSGPPRTA